MTERTPNPRWLYIPLIERGGIFLESPEGRILGLENAAAPSLSSFIAANYERKVARVQLAGRIYRTAVFVPVSIDDYSYVIADEDRVPLGAALEGSEDPVLLDHTREYLDTVFARLSYGEAIFPEQSTYLWSQFLRPRFVELTPDLPRGEMERSWESLLASTRSVLVGPPGAGKTSCLRRLALEYASRTAANDPFMTATIPVYVQLREWRSSSDVEENVRRQLLREGARWIAENFETLGEEGRILLLLDGLDEVSENLRGRTIDSLKEMCRRLAGIRVFISSRPWVLGDGIEGFLHFRLQPFTVSQIKEWSIQRLHQRKPWGHFLSALAGHPDVLELAGNPLMLSLTAAHYLRSDVWPSDRPQVLQTYIRALTEDWDSIRGVNRCEEAWAAPHKKLATACRVSFWSAQAERSKFSTKEFVDWEALRAEGETAERMLEALVEHTGMLRWTGDGELEFDHSALQNHLAAIYLVESTGSLRRLFSKQLRSRKWQEIWLDACGLASDPSELILFVLNAGKISDVIKAALLMRVLGQDLSIKETVREEALDFILGVYEKELRGVLVKEEPVEDEVSELGETIGIPRGRILWMVEIRRAKRTMEEGELRGVLELVRAAYVARAGRKGVRLEEELSRARGSAARIIATGFKHEGKFWSRVLKGGGEVTARLGVAEV